MVCTDSTNGLRARGFPACVVDATPLQTFPPTACRRTDIDRCLYSTRPTHGLDVIADAVPGWTADRLRYQRFRTSRFVAPIRRCSRRYYTWFPTHRELHLQPGLCADTPANALLLLAFCCSRRRCRTTFSSIAFPAPCIGSIFLVRLGHAILGRRHGRDSRTLRTAHAPLPLPAVTTVPGVGYAHLPAHASHPHLLLLNIPLLYTPSAFSSGLG